MKAINLYELANKESKVHANVNVLSKVRVIPFWGILCSAKMYDLLLSLEIITKMQKQQWALEWKFKKVIQVAQICSWAKVI